MLKLKVLVTAGLISGFCLNLAHADSPLPVSAYVNAKSPEFNRSVLTTGLQNPHNVVWGADNNLWLTEQKTGNVIRVNPETGEKTVIYSIPDVVYDEGTQNGLLGIALDPKFTVKGHSYVYVSLSIKNPKATDPEFPNQTVIRRYTYDAKQQTLTNPVTIIDGLPSAHDHQSARILIGPDHKIYYTIGDQGANQIAYLFKPNQAQVAPTAEQIKNHDYHTYAGKVLRLNLDGSIPQDNPRFNGVQSHLYTMGHRNPQGMVFTPKGVLISSEQGPSSDDEINIIKKGGNYGWPNVAGYQDDSGYAYLNFSAAKGDQSKIKDPAHNGMTVPAGVPVTKESQWHADNFVPPIKTLFTVPSNYNFDNPVCGDHAYVCWPTVSPSSIYFYKSGNKAIPGWKDSVLVTSLKHGILFHIQLDPTHQKTIGKAVPILRGIDRYRDVVANPSGDTLYVITDLAGVVQKDDGSVTTTVDHPGSILKFTYKGK